MSHIAFISNSPQYPYFKWIIRRSHVVEDFHGCVEVFFQDSPYQDLRDMVLEIHNEEGVGIGAARSIFNHYFTQMRKNTRLFEIHACQSVLPRRITAIADLSEIEKFGFMVHAAWYLYQFIPRQFHPFIILSACSGGLFNHTQKYIFSLYGTSISKMLNLAGISFPSEFDEWCTTSDGPFGTEVHLSLDAQCLRYTYYLDHILDSELELEREHYYTFYDQSTKYILFSFRHFAFKYICWGGEEVNNHSLGSTTCEEDMHVLFNKLLDCCDAAQTKPVFDDMIFHIMLQPLPIPHSPPPPYHAIVPESSHHMHRTSHHEFNLRLRHNAVTSEFEDQNEETKEVGKEVLLMFNLFRDTILQLEKEDAIFIEQFLIFTTSCPYIEDAIFLQFTNVKQL